MLRLLHTLLAPLVRWRLGPWRAPFHAPDPSLPARAAAPGPRVAVLGAGLAGLAAATTLARAGARVVLFEREAHIGGKLGSWVAEGPGGEAHRVSHGFHAFFAHYHNLWGWLEELGLRRGFRTIPDYNILLPGGRALGFVHTLRTPVFNLLDLARQGLYRMSDILGTDAMHEMDAFLRYDPETTYARYDHVTYAEFASRNALPPSLRLVFNTFSRAFFADPERMSMAELIKSFHFYYLSHDGGLLYDYPTDDFEPSLLAPLRAVLAEQGVDLRLGVDARTLGGDADTLVVDGERFDDVVIATHVVAARDMLTDSPLFVEHPEWSARVSQLRAGQRYAVLRVWFDRDVRTDVAEFVITERVRVLDAVCLVHRTEATSAAWARPRGASVIELHCYAVPDGLADDAAIREALLDDLPAFFPELDGAARLGEHLRVARDFAAFHVGQHAIRPEVATPDPRVSLAGDWVRLPFPAMLMEGAVASGRLAANRVLDRHGLQGAPVWSVPARGMLAGVPEPPKPPHIRARLSVPPV